MKQQDNLNKILKNSTVYEIPKLRIKIKNLKDAKKQYDSVIEDFILQRCDTRESYQEMKVKIIKYLNSEFIKFLLRPIRNTWDDWYQRSKEVSILTELGNLSWEFMPHKMEELITESYYKSKISQQEIAIEKEKKQWKEKERKEILEWSCQNDYKHEYAQYLRDKFIEAKSDGKIKEMEKIDSIMHGAITSEMIEQARNYPIEKLLEVKRNFARCPFHEDKNPSFYCKGNYGYCFSCGEKGDVIKVYQKVNGVGFKEAILELSK